MHRLNLTYSQDLIEELSTDENEYSFLSKLIQEEINREIIRTIYKISKNAISIPKHIINEIMSQI